MRQIEFALFDMRLHQCESVESAERIQQILDEVRAEVGRRKYVEFG